MPVTFHIPGSLREFTAGHSRVEIEHSPTNLADALSALWTLYPGVRDRIATEQGQVREHINIFIGDENVRYTGGLASPVSAGSEISIVPAVSGGSENSCSALYIEKFRRILALPVTPKISDRLPEPASGVLALHPFSKGQFKI